MLIPYATAYLYESGCNTLLSIKTKSKNHLNAQAVMRVAISNIVPRCEKLICKKTNKGVIELKYISKLLGVSLLIYFYTDYMQVVHSNVNLCHPFLSICMIFFAC